MNPQLNKVFSKLAKAEKTELKSEKVELGLRQDAEKLNTIYYSKTDTANSNIKALSSEARAAMTNIDQALKAVSEMKSLVSKLEKAAKELGIDVNNMQELKSMKVAIKDSSEYESYKKVLKSII
tara:strand:- start:99 stop:470 length:372 start_codon:yes stop_codon:yes gene_type:complete